MPPRTKLRPKELFFAQAVAAGKDATEAARIAGYAPKGMADDSNAFRLANRPIVKAEIQRLQSQRSELREITVDSWKRELTYQYNRVRDSDSANALRALEDIGKHIGALDPQRPISPETQLLIEIMRQAAANAIGGNNARQLPGIVDKPLTAAYQVLEGEKDETP